MEKNLCSSALQNKKRFPSDQDLKRISASMFHFIAQGKDMKKYVTPKGSGEGIIRGIWEKAMDLEPLEMSDADHQKILENKGDDMLPFNYLPECVVCHPSLPIYCGKPDGFLISKDGRPIIVEFKGIIKNVILDIAPTMAQETKYMAQMILYSFLMGWMDVWFVWGE